MGSVLLRSTRYATSLLFLSSLPFFVLGYVVLRMWVGAGYAQHSVQLLRVLVLANIIRNMCSPYATMVVATGNQRFATVAAVTEGTVNLVSSIWLAQHIGAIGVAIGTLVGAVAGVAAHFAVSMRFTQATLAISRRVLLVKGMLRPAVAAVPSILLFGYWWRPETPSMPSYLYGGWILATLFLAWFVSVNGDDRAFLAGLVRNKMSALQGRP
jgi:O-antigen/teichoic acid export membrane protein